MYVQKGFDKKEMTEHQQGGHLTGLVGADKDKRGHKEGTGEPHCPLSGTPRANERAA